MLNRLQVKTWNLPHSHSLAEVNFFASCVNRKLAKKYGVNQLGAAAREARSSSAELNAGEWTSVTVTALSHALPPLTKNVAYLFCLVLSFASI